MDKVNPNCHNITQGICPLNWQVRSSGDLLFKLAGKKLRAFVLYSKLAGISSGILPVTVMSGKKLRGLTLKTWVNKLWLFAFPELLVVSLSNHILKLFIKEW